MKTKLILSLSIILSACGGGSSSSGGDSSSDPALKAAEATNCVMTFRNDAARSFDIANGCDKDANVIYCPNHPETSNCPTAGIVVTLKVGERRNVRLVSNSYYRACFVPFTPTPLNETGASCR